MKPILPQQDPIRMVDDVVFQDHDHVSTSLLLTRDKYLSGEAALVEFAAQSCAALMGCRSQHAAVGYIGEVRHFEIVRIPTAGELLQCDLEVMAELGGIVLVEAVVLSAGERMAQGRIKLSVND